MREIAILPVLCIALLLMAGCSAPTPPPPATTVPPTATPSVPDLTPQPTSVVPPYYAVSVQVLKNTVSIDPYIVVTFNGGQGLGFATLMQATVIRSDGTMESKSARNPAINTELILDGTTRTDRVIVNVSYVDGSTYTVRDLLVPFQNINPTAAFT